MDDFVRATHLYRPLRFLFFLSPGIWFERRRAPPAAASAYDLPWRSSDRSSWSSARLCSTRRDLLPSDIADELAKLQDRVPPFPGTVAVATIERAYGRPMPEVFAEFDTTPLAAASIAQVHVARLLDGKEVVVKVLRPGMRDWIQRDLEVLYAFARLAHRYWSDARRLRPIEIVAEYEKTILDELDLMREAANAAQLKRNFAGSDLLYVRDVYFDFCRLEVMVMERRSMAMQISDLTRLRAAGARHCQVSRKRRAYFFHPGVPA